MSSLKAIQRRAREAAARRYNRANPEAAPQEPKSKKQTFGSSLDWGENLPNETQQFSQEDLEKLAEDPKNKVYTWKDMEKPKNGYSHAQLYEKCKQLNEMFHYYRSEIIAQDNLQGDDLKENSYDLLKDIAKEIFTNHVEFVAFEKFYNQYWISIVSGLNVERDGKHMTSFFKMFEMFPIAQKKRMKFDEGLQFYGNYLLDQHAQDKEKFQRENPDVRILESNVN